MMSFPCNGPHRMVHLRSVEQEIYHSSMHGFRHTHGGNGLVDQITSWPTENLPRRRDRFPSRRT